jgi:hypothetical protein
MIPDSGFRIALTNPQSQIRNPSVAEGEPQ